MFKIFSTSLAYYLAWIGFLAFGFLAWYFSSKGRQEEQKILIQNGMNAEDLYKRIHKRRQLWFLKIGIVIIGLGMSFVLIAILDNLHLMHPDALFPGIFCLCIGISLVIAYQIGKKGHEE
jgi:hypothetical protein